MKKTMAAETSSQVSFPESGAAADILQGAELDWTAAGQCEVKVAPAKQHKLV